MVYKPLGKTLFPHYGNQVSYLLCRRYKINVRWAGGYKVRHYQGLMFVSRLFHEITKCILSDQSILYTRLVQNVLSHCCAGLFPLHWNFLPECKKNTSDILEKIKFFTNLIAVFAVTLLFMVANILL